MLIDSWITAFHSSGCWWTYNTCLASLWIRLTLFFCDLMNGLLFWNLWKCYISLGWERHRETKIDSTALGCGKLLQKGQHDIFNLCVVETHIAIHMLPNSLSCSCLPGKRLGRVSLVQNYLWNYFLQCTIPSLPDAPFCFRNPSLFWKSCLWYFCGNEETVVLSKMEIFLGRHWVACLFPENLVSWSASTTLCDIILTLLNS